MRRYARTRKGKVEEFSYSEVRHPTIDMIIAFLQAGCDPAQAGDVFEVEGVGRVELIEQGESGAVWDVPFEVNEGAE